MELKFVSRQQLLSKQIFCKIFWIFTFSHLNDVDLISAMREQEQQKLTNIPLLLIDLKNHEKFGNFEKKKYFSFLFSRRKQTVAFVVNF